MENDGQVKRDAQQTQRGRARAHAACPRALRAGVSRVGAGSDILLAYVSEEALSQYNLIILTRGRGRRERKSRRNALNSCLDCYHRVAMGSSPMGVRGRAQKGENVDHVPKDETVVEDYQ
jgi:hypothetical protein